MNILYLSFPQGGLDTSVMVLGKELVRQGHRVSVLYIDSSGKSVSFLKKPEEFRVHHAGIGQIHYYLNKLIGSVSSLPKTVQTLEFSSAFQRAVREISQKEKIDLIEIPEIFVTSAKTGGIPYVVRLHSADWTWRLKLGEKKRFSDGWDQKLEALSLKEAAGISSPSQELKEIIGSECRVKRPMEVIPYPVDLNQFKPTAEKIHPPTVLFVGRVEERKGADTLLDAAGAVLSKMPECRFVFIGSVSGEMRARVARAPKQVSFLNTVSHDSLPEWYQKATIFAAPSRWDNSPNTIYEAMACGTPVIASRTGGIPELIEDNVTGLLVRPGHPEILAEAIASLLSDKARLEKMGREAHEKASRDYSAQIISEKTLTFYKQVLAAV